MNFDNTKASEALKKAFDTLLQVDIPTLKQQVSELKSRHPRASKKKLAKKVFSKTRFRATILGAATGVATNPFIMIPAAIADVAITINAEKDAAACVALIYNPDFFSDEKAVLKLLIPVLGISSLSETAEKSVEEIVLKKEIPWKLSLETANQLKKIALKSFKMRVFQKGIITKTLPLVGSVLGAGWNWREVSAIRKRTIRYFEGESLQ